MPLTGVGLGMLTHPTGLRPFPRAIPILLSPADGGRAAGSPRAAGRGRAGSSPFPSRPGDVPGLTEAEIPDFPPQNRWLPAQPGVAPDSMGLSEPPGDGGNAGTWN